MADGLFYRDLREPFFVAELGAVSLSTTNKALYTVANFPVLGGNYFGRPGKKMKIRVFGKITTAATPGNLTVGCYYGTGADANGVLLASSAAQTLVASQTTQSFMIELWIKCLTTGATGTLFCNGRAQFTTAVIAAGSFLVPAATAVASAACDLTAANILSVQALRSGSTAETMAVQDLEVEACN